MIDSENNGRGAELHLLLVVEVEEHDDEDKEDHNGAGVDEDLNDADEVGIQSNEQSGQSDEGKDHRKGAGDGVAKSN